MPSEKPEEEQNPSGTLRGRATQMMRATRSDVEAMTADEVQHLIQELQIHQIELELQNEELRGAQAELTEARDRYSDLYEFAPVGNVTLDRDGRVLEGNLTAARMLGVTRESLTRSNLSEFVTRESQDEWFLYRRAIFASEAGQACEVGMQKADGTRLMVRLDSIAFELEEGRHCHTALTDITPQKEAEEALRALSEELEHRVEEQTGEIRFLARALVDIGEGVLITGDTLDWPGPRIEFVNEAMCRISGYTADELIGQAPRILQGERTNREALDRIRADLRTGQSSSCELVNYRKDGTPYDVELLITPLFDSVGRHAGFVSIHRDVTERKQAAEDLINSEGRMRAILATATDAILTIDRRGMITGVNPATEEMFGYTEDELVGQNVSILMPQPYCDEHDGYIDRYLETGQARIIGIGREVEGCHKNGTIFPVDLAVSEVPGLDIFTGIIRDISNRKRIEQELEKSRNDLRTMSSELMLIEERERRQLGQDLHDGLGQTLFLLQQKVSSTPMDNEDADELRSMLGDAAKTVNTLTFELSPPILRDLGLVPAVKWLAKDLQQRYGLSVQVETDSRAFPIDDRGAVVVFRSVRELLINAAKHAGTPQATVSFRKLDHGVQITVQDQGKGFVPADQTRAVDAGHFGLFSVRERVEYLGGTLEVESAPDRGTTITLTMPLPGGSADVETS